LKRMIKRLFVGITKNKPTIGGLVSEISQFFTF